MTEWVFTVSEVGEFLKKSFDSEPRLQNLRVRGEVSDFKRAASGHAYFTLKDERAVLRCVWFRQDQRVGQKVTEGMKVSARGRLGFYSEQGQVNFYVREVETSGFGSLYVLFEQRKERFRALGYFDSERKRPLPAMPMRVGVVTSPTGAVIRDIIRIARRRNPRTQIVLYPVKVQGDGAAQEIARGIQVFNRLGTVDVLIVGRGGGSFEDLWEFNDEAVVRAIVESRIPIVTAIGHETDFSLADFAADLRAATPSEAAELAVPDAMALLRAVDEQRGRATGAMLHRLAREEARLALLEQGLELHGPRERVTQMALRLDGLRERLDNAANRELTALDARLSMLGNRLGDLNPMAVLGRGYAAVYSPSEGRYIARAGELAPGQTVDIRFADAARRARVLQEG